MQIAVLAGMPSSGSVPRNLSGVFLSSALGFFFPAVFQEDVSQQVGLQKRIWNKSHIKKITRLSINFAVCDPEINLTTSALWKGVAHGLCPLQSTSPI